MRKAFPLHDTITFYTISSPRMYQPGWGALKLVYIILRCIQHGLYVSSISSRHNTVLAHKNVRHNRVDVIDCCIWHTTHWRVVIYLTKVSLQCRHNGRDVVSNHQPHDCLLNRLFRRRSQKTSKLRVTGLCAGIPRWPVNSPHKWPVKRKMFPFDDVIMIVVNIMLVTR